MMSAKELQLQAWEARLQQNYPPCARTCPKPASQLLHAAAGPWLVPRRASVKAAQATPDGVGVNLLFMLAASNWHMLLYGASGARKDNKWCWELLEGQRQC